MNKMEGRETGSAGQKKAGLYHRSPETQFVSKWRNRILVSKKFQRAI
jgi:hypothetical protein